MNIGPTGTFDTATTNGLNTGGDYYPSFHNHYQPHTKPHSNGYYDSSKLNGHNGVDNNEDEQQQQQQQQTDNDYDMDDIDKPKLLMWGLKKYRI
jgi:hypothetical protein